MDCFEHRFVAIRSDALSAGQDARLYGSPEGRRYVAAGVSPAVEGRRPRRPVFQANPNARNFPKRETWKQQRN